MRILQISALILSFMIAYALPTVAAPADSTPPPHEMHKIIKGPSHHRGTSMAMMKELNLDAKQREQWKVISAQKKAETEPLHAQMNKLREQELLINKKYEAKIKKILTAEQAQKYESLLWQKPENPNRPKPLPKKK